MSVLQDNPILKWVLDEGWKIEDHIIFTKKLTECFLDAGFTVCRLRLGIRLLHPQVFGLNFTWYKDRDEIEVFEAFHELLLTEQYLESPFAALFDDGAGAIRRKLNCPEQVLDFPVLHEFKEEGVTDYVALPLDFSDGRRSVLSICSNAEEGFTSDQLSILYESLSAISRIVENFALKHTASVLMQTYLGKQTGNEVLSGKVKRGDGQRIRCIIWFSDLRQSTHLAETMHHDDFLSLLNDYFECTAGAVLDNNGEVLRYIGDAVLAIFPIGPSKECSETNEAAINAANAAKFCFERLEELNKENMNNNRPEIKTGIGLHVGEVMYGNIGTTTRLEFSVIGSSANEASRIEGMTKELSVPIVCSSQFIELHGAKFRSLGHHFLKGFSEERELFTFE